MIAKAPTPKAPGNTPQKMLLAAEVPMDFRRFFFVYDPHIAD
jgi:hypothetical protein